MKIWLPAGREKSPPFRGGCKGPCMGGIDGAIGAIAPSRLKSSRIGVPWHPISALAPRSSYIEFMQNFHIGSCAFYPGLVLVVGCAVLVVGVIGVCSSLQQHKRGQVAWSSTYDLPLCHCNKEKNEESVLQRLQSPHRSAEKLNHCFLGSGGA